MYVFHSTLCVKINSVQFFTQLQPLLVCVKKNMLITWYYAISIECWKHILFWKEINAYDIQEIIMCKYRVYLLYFTIHPRFSISPRIICFSALKENFMNNYIEYRRHVNLKMCQNICYQYCQHYTGKIYQITHLIITISV